MVAVVGVAVAEVVVVAIAVVGEAAVACLRTLRAKSWWAVGSRSKLGD